MSLRRRALLALGASAAVAGIAIAVDPSLARGLGVRGIVVTSLGGLAVLQGLRVMRSRRNTDVETAEPVDAESTPTMPTPGDRFDDAVSSLSGFGRPGHVDARERIRDRLHEAALATIERRYDCTRAEAVALLRAGEWTDDPEMATFFVDAGTAADGGSDVDASVVETDAAAIADRGPGGQSRLSRLRSRLAGEYVFTRRARRAAETIAAHANVLPEEDR